MRVLQMAAFPRQAELGGCVPALWSAKRFHAYRAPGCMHAYKYSVDKV
jgi:hypothetical protein